jgi:hypothetical protein
VLFVDANQMQELVQDENKSAEQSKKEADIAEAARIIFG